MKGPPIRKRPLHRAKGPRLKSNAPPDLGGAPRRAALLNPPERLRSRDKNREYEKEAESKREARHAVLTSLSLRFQAATYGHFDISSIQRSGKQQECTRLIPLDSSRVPVSLRAMHRASLLLLSNALGLIGRGLLCVGGRAE